VNPWGLEHLVDAMEGTALSAGNRAGSGAVRIDSRLVQEGDLFFAICGENHNAHRYVGDVILRHAAAVVVHETPAAAIVASAKQHGVALLQVDDTIAALNRLAGAYRGTLRGRVIAIGGSNGKTTTKRILDAVLAEQFRGHASPKSFNNNIGVPLTLLEASVEQDYVILEIGTNAPGEIAMLGAVCRPDIAAIVSIGLEHLELLIDLQGVANEEAAIAGHLPADGLLVIPADVAELNAALRGATQRIVAVGGADSAIAARDIEQTVDGLTFSVGDAAFRLPLLGLHNVSNALIAIAIARHLGMSDQAIARGLQNATPADMRLMTVSIGGHHVINDAYNANPTSMAAALKTFSELRGISGRKVAIIGDMLELGGMAGQLHAEIGAQAATSQIGLLITVGSLMKHAASAARQAGMDVIEFSATADAAKRILEIIQPGDAILLKGSRGMRMEQILVPLKNQADGGAAGQKIPATAVL
jgi:UDP-N-acetylmuramoyl-tripeptide--D-alanyl-D-alanine ligase